MEANDGRQAQGAYIPQELLKEISKVNNRLLIGIPRERCEAEKRLPLTPEAVDMLTDCGWNFCGRRNDHFPAILQSYCSGGKCIAWIYFV